jgi:hypothetical protein
MGYHNDVMKQTSHLSGVATLRVRLKNRPGSGVGRVASKLESFLLESFLLVFCFLLVFRLEDRVIVPLRSLCFLFERIIHPIFDDTLYSIVDCVHTSKRATKTNTTQKEKDNKPHRHDN